MRNPTLLGGVALVLLAACGGGTTSPGGGYGGGNNGGSLPQIPSGSPAPSATINVVNNAFQANSVLIQVGGTVTWTWVGSGHSVTSSGTPSFAPSAPVSNAGTVLGPVVFAATGDYQYYCSVHGGTSGGYVTGMSGVVYVR
jgi:plastocyanin